MSSLSRRSVIKRFALGTIPMVLPGMLSARLQVPVRPVTFGVITDVHIGFVPGAEERLRTFLDVMKKVKPDGLIQMGDFAYPDARYQSQVDMFNAASEHTIHAIGNHELDHGLTRDDAMKSWGIPGYYYAQEVGGVKIVVLDGNDQGSPTYGTHGGYHSYIGPSQQAWLENELSEAKQPVLIVSHQPLAGVGALDNAKDMQELLSKYKDKIMLALNGHAHIDQHVEVGGVNYLHINSASYFWLGGKARLAPYKDALFTTLKIDMEAGSISVEACRSRWAKSSPEETGYFEAGKNVHKRGLVKPEISGRLIEWSS